MTKITKVPYSVVITPEARAILKKRARNAGLTQSEYLENLIRRGESDIYDQVIQEILDYYAVIKSHSLMYVKIVEDNQALLIKLRKLLNDIGISPNQMPD